MISVALAGQLHTADTAEHSDLNQVIARCESAIVQTVQHGVSVQFALSPNVARVAVGAEDLRRIAVALCTEACGALGAGGRLLVETRGLNDAQVASSAMRTPTEAFASLSVRIEQRGEPTTGVRSQLPAAAQPGAVDLKVTLERLGGRFELVAASEHGLTYVAHLPYVAPTNSSGRMPVAVARGTEVILLVEDEPQVQAVTARILRAFGYAVITAHNERTALAQAELHGPAIGLVISDLVLPGVSGVELVRRLRHPCEHARVLYVSGYSSEHVGALVGGALFLRKPFTAEELVTMVRDLLASSVH
jgi:CheY-like chemotaxis protein